MSERKPQVIRRIVTGHDSTGKAKVLIDAPATNIKSSRPGQFSTLVWCTDDAPAAMPVGEDAEDMGARVLGTYPPEHGTRFMIAEYPPGNTGRRHRTETIDYIVVLSGEIDMELDKGETVHLKAGDVMVQRGTYHTWLNRGTEPCRMVFVLVDANPLGLGEP
jgi:quercetin dioxygenase-like cupin family protein